MMLPMCMPQPSWPCRFQMDGRPVEFLHAYSGAEARKIFGAHDDIALTYLDVVMESDDARLQVVKWLREERGKLVLPLCIVLRHRPARPGTGRTG